MNEKLQYASMLEIPVNTCSVTIKENKRKGIRKKRDVDSVKEQLINKVNLEQEQSLEVDESESAEDVLLEQNEIVNSSAVVSKIERKKRSKLSIIGAQFIIIGALVATIFLTNAFYPESGINVFMREVFGSGSQEVGVDERLYEQFAPVIALDEGATLSLENGVMNFSGKLSVYSPCDGTVGSITKQADGTFSVEVLHSTNFSTCIDGLEHVYVENGGQVFFNIPLGYSVDGGASMCFKGANGEVISNYQIIDDWVVWG